MITSICVARIFAVKYLIKTFKIFIPLRVNEMRFLLRSRKFVRCAITNVLICKLETLNRKYIYVFKFLKRE